MTVDNVGPADPSAAEPTQAAEKPAFRKHTNADGLLHVVKGRSYIEPISGRSPPLSLQQGINGLVGKRKVCKGDIEDLKKHRGMVMGNADSIISSLRFVPASKAFGWIRLTETAVAASKEVSMPSSGPKTPVYTLETLDNPRLYPSMTYFDNRRKQGQCYSLMMSALCQKRLFYAELTRARRVAEKTTFIRTRQQARLQEKNRQCQGHESQDDHLVKSVRDFMHGVRRKSLLAAAMKSKMMLIKKSKAVLSEIASQETVENDE